MNRHPNRLAVAAVLAATALAACTGSGSRPGPAGASPSSSSPTAASPSGSSSSPTVPTYGGARLGAPPCVVGLPAAWKRAVQRGRLWHGVWDHHPTGAPTPDGSGVLLQQDEGAVAHVVLVGAGHRVVESIGDVPNPSREGQVIYNAIGRDYGEFVFAPVNGEAASWRWQLYLWDRRAHRLRLIAHNPVDAAGRPLHGGWVQPQLTADAITWIQATPDRTGGWGGSALMEYSLATGHIRTLYSGLVTAFVRYNDTVLYAAIKPGTPPPAPTEANGPPLHIAAVNPATGAAVTAPAGLTFGSDTANTVITDGDLIAWANNLEIRAWRPAWGRSITLVPEPSQWPAAARLGAAATTYPRLYGHFLAWNAGPTLVLDLRTNSVAPLGPTANGDDMSGSWLSLEGYTTPTSYDKATGMGKFDQTLLNLAHLPGLSAC